MKVNTESKKFFKISKKQLIFFDYPLVDEYSLTAFPFMFNNDLLTSLFPATAIQAF